MFPEMDAEKHVVADKVLGFVLGKRFICVHYQLIQMINYVDNQVIKISLVWTNDKIMTLTKEYD